MTRTSIVTSLHFVSSLSILSLAFALGCGGELFDISSRQQAATVTDPEGLIDVSVDHPANVQVGSSTTLTFSVNYKGPKVNTQPNLIYTTEVVPKANIKNAPQYSDVYNVCGEYYINGVAIEVVPYSTTVPIVGATSWDKTFTCTTAGVFQVEWHVMLGYWKQLTTEFNPASNLPKSAIPYHNPKGKPEEVYHPVTVTSTINCLGAKAYARAMAAAAAQAQNSPKSGGSPEKSETPKVEVKVGFNE